MKVLILSCDTGEGHNSAAAAVAGALTQRGIENHVFDPLVLAGKYAERFVSGAYTTIMKKAPLAFNALYRAGDIYSSTGITSPVYHANARYAANLRAFIETNGYDRVVCTHLYPMETLTAIRKSGDFTVPCYGVLTDYTCIPFTEECRLDAYVIPAPALTAEFVGWGIPEEKIYPFGIPVGRVFREAVSKAEAKRQLALAEGKRYVLVSGGSIGAGSLEKTMELLTDLTRGTDFHVIAICGSNASVRRQLEKRFGAEATLLGNTDKMALYLRACDLYLTKPGGLSTTEAAVAEVPLGLLPPIPGCESRNLQFFTQTGMAVPVTLNREALEHLLKLPEDTALLQHMYQAQRSLIAKDAAEKICILAESLV